MTEMRNYRRIPFHTTATILHDEHLSDCELVEIALRGALLETKEDIPLLLELFIRDFCRENNLTIPRISPEVFKALMTYDWKGNVRELKNTVQELVVFSRNGQIEPESIPGHILAFASLPSIKEESNHDLAEKIAHTEAETIRRVMKIAAGNKSRAAKLLNIPRGTLYYKLDQYGLRNFS